MKLLIIVLSFLTFNLFSQNIDSVKKYWYIRSNPISIYSGSGTLDNKLNQNIEIGKSFSLLDVGISYGRYNLLSLSQFIEARLTLDAFQINQISSEFSVGGGYVFNNNNNIMLEYSYTILYQVHNKLGIGVITGTYDFSGPVNDINKNFFGILVRYGLLRNTNGGLLFSRAKNHHKSL